MSSFFKKFFGGKKDVKATKKAVSRRLELLGLEDRITPATISLSNDQVVIQLVGSEDISNLSTSISGALITITTTTTSPNTPLGTGISGLNISAGSIVVDTTVLTNFSGIQVLGVSGAGNRNDVSIGAAGMDLSAAPGGANQSISIDLAQATVDQDTLTVQGPIKTKGTGSASLSSVFVDLSANGAITTTSTGNAAITALQEIKTAAKVTTVSGNITFTGDTMLTGNVEVNTTAGNVLFDGRVFGDHQSTGIFGLKANTGSGTFRVVNDIGYRVITPSNFPLSYLKVATTNTSAQAISLSGSLNHVDSGELNLSATGGIAITGKVFATSVLANSSAGDISFGDEVQTTGPGGFTSTTAADKATKIADAVNVLNGASATIYGNLIVNDVFNAIIDVTATGAISITGNVTAATAGNDFEFSVDNGVITVGGMIGSDAVPLGFFSAGGNIGSTLSAFTANGGVFSQEIYLGSFGKSVDFAGAVKLASGGTTSTGLFVDVIGSGTITFGKSIELTDANAPISLSTDDGAITVNGTITGKSGITIVANGNGNITLAGAVTTDQSNGLINIQSGTGNISITGAVNTLGSAASIEIDTITSGNIILDGNISTSGGGSIFLGTEISGSPPATGTGNLTINGTVSTTGTTNSGDIAIGSGGTGTVTINKAISTGAASTSAGIMYLIAVGTQVNTINVSKDVTINSADSVIFQTTGSTNTISLASGANINAVNGISDNGAGTGNLVLANNLTTTNGLISLNSVSVSLAGPVSMKAGGQAGNINIGNTNGAQNLTLETTGNIVASSSTAIGGLTPLNSLTVVNSANSVFLDLNSASVTITDTTNFIYFNGNTVISKSLTTTTEPYSVNFINGKTAVISGAPVFLNTGNVIMQGTTSLPGGATITGGPSTDANLAGSIVSGGAFNIGSGISSINISDNTQLILNSTSAASTFASPISLNSTGSGTLKLLGVGTLNLSADSTTGAASNDSIEVINGTLNVTGKIASTVTSTNGTITGAGGTIGALNSTVGNVTPGGTLKTGAVTLDAATNYNVAITGATIASNLETGSAINLGNAVLNITSVEGGLFARNTFTILNNTAASGTNLITTTFAGLPEGGNLSVVDSLGNTVTFAISYVGGVGDNDVTLTVTNVSVANPDAIPQPMVSGQPVLNKFTAVGADAGGGPMVTVTFNSITGLTTQPTYFSFFAYDVGFTGGVRVAIGDLDGSPTTLEIVTAPGAGGGPNIRVFQFDVATLKFNSTPVSSFFAFGGPAFTGGAYVAAGDVNGDGLDDVIVGAGAGGGPRVQVYSGSVNGLVTNAPSNDFFAYSPAFTGGVVVAAGERSGDNVLEVITAPASNGGYHIQSFDCNGTGNNPTVVESFFAFNNSTSIGGLSIAVGVLDGNALDDLVVGTTNNQFGVIVNQNYGGIQTTPFPGFLGAIRAGVAADELGRGYAVAAAGPGGGPVTTVYGVVNNSLSQTDSLFVLNPQFTGGLFVSS